MILRGAQIQRRGHGKCGLLSDRVCSCNLAEMAYSAVAPLIATHRYDRRLVSSLFEQGIVRPCSTARIIHQFNSFPDDGAKCAGRAEQRFQISHHNVVGRRQEGVLPCGVNGPRKDSCVANTRV